MYIIIGKDASRPTAVLNSESKTNYYLSVQIVWFDPQ